MSAKVMVRRLALLALVAPLAGCEWFSDFKRQPNVVTWESLRSDSSVVRGAPQGSVPMTGTFMPAFGVSYAQLPGVIDSLASIPNPTPITEASLANGRKYFQINCAVCHGNNGAGDGLATKWGMVPMTLMSDIMKSQRTDGYIYGMMRNGRGLMPSYNRIPEMDRWDVVNYIRALQGKVTNVAFQTGPLAPPGVTGPMVPGPTRLGPSRGLAPVLPAMSPTAAPLPAPEHSAADTAKMGESK
ncbi:MAG: cytochrome c [Gemmatimonadaceae bacterium]